MTSIEEMKEQKFIDWGNGEPCPFCGKHFDKADMNHVMDEHKEIAMEILF